MEGVEASVLTEVENAPAPLEVNREYLIFYDSDVIDTEVVMNVLDNMPKFHGMFVPVHVPRGMKLGDVIKFAAKDANAGTT